MKNNPFFEWLRTNLTTMMEQRSPKLAWVGIALLLIPASVVAVWGTIDSGAPSKHYWLFTVIAGFATSALASFAVLFFGYEKLLHALREHEVRGALGKVLEFWSAIDVQRKGMQIIYGGSLGSFLDDKSSNTSLSTIYSIQQLQNTFKKVFGSNMSTPYCSFSKIPDVSHITTHIVLLGGYLSIPGLKDFPSKAGVTYHQDFEQKERKVVLGSVSRPSRIFESQLDAAEALVVEDYGVVTLITEKDKRSIVWLSGNYGLATYGAVLFLTRPELIEKLEIPKPGHYTQLVLRIDKIENNELLPDHRDIRVCTTQSGDLHPDFSLSMIATPVVAAGGKP